jgi:hypothetical protein
MHLELDPPQIELVTRARDLARKNFAPRAPEYDRAAAFPVEDFKDLFGSWQLWFLASMGAWVWVRTAVTSLRCG